MLSPSRTAPEFSPPAIERRSHPTPIFSRFALVGGRRASARRGDDDREIFVDRYGTRLFLAIMAVIMLNLLDAWFTLLFLAHGGRDTGPRDGSGGLRSAATRLAS